MFHFLAVFSINILNICIFDKRFLLLILHGNIFSLCKKGKSVIKMLRAIFPFIVMVCLFFFQKKIIFSFSILIIICVVFYLKKDCTNLTKKLIFRKLHNDNLPADLEGTKWRFRHSYNSACCKYRGDKYRAGVNMWDFDNPIPQLSTPSFS